MPLFGIKKTNMLSDPADTERILTPLLYILSKFSDNTINKHKALKILYFADKEHLAKYGRTFSEDTYIKMKDGPVASRVFDYIRISEKSYPYAYPPLLEEMINSLIEVDGKWIKAKKQPNDIYLSKSMIAGLSKFIGQYKNAWFGPLRDASHDSAWHAAPQNGEMSLIDIAKDAGANDEMLEYIKENL